MSKFGRPHWSASPFGPLNASMDSFVQNLNGLIMTVRQTNIV